MREQTAGWAMAGHYDTGRRLSIAVLGYYVAVVAIITLVPFQFEVPQRFALMLRGTLLDTSANVLFFVPLGFLYRLARPSCRDRAALGVLVLGVVVSAVVETLQLFEQARYSSPLDVGANGVGAWLGALVADLVARRIRPDAALVGRLSLEIPLMGLVYALVPLLWLGSLGAGRESMRLWMMLLPGLFGARLLVFVHRHRLGRFGAISARNVAIAAGAGMLIGLFPAVGRHPAQLVLMAAIVGIAVWLQARTGVVHAGQERRFELDALRSAVPVFLVYLVVATWLGRGGEPDVSAVMRAVGRAAIVRQLEMVAAFTVLGYVLAEWRSRLDLSLRDGVRRVLLATAPVAALVATGRFLPSDPLAVPLWFVTLVTASGYGALLYDLQRAHVRALIHATTPAVTT